jgi:hypothetical protein
MRERTLRSPKAGQRINGRPLWPWGSPVINMLGELTLQHFYKANEESVRPMVILHECPEVHHLIVMVWKNFKAHFEYEEMRK